MRVRVFTSKGPLTGVPNHRTWTKGQTITTEIIDHTLEDQINWWLGQNPAIKIVEIRQSLAPQWFAPPLCVVTIWYEPASELLDRKAAEELVLTHLNGSQPECRQDKVITQVLEKPFGWVFYYDSKQHVETSDAKSQLLGGYPILVDRRDATLHFTGLGRIEDYIQRYEKTGRTDG
jgi:hypothetical protein